MQTSKKKNKKTRNWFFVYLVLLLSSLFMFWFSQQSITFYWQQTYHTDPIISTLEKYEPWRQGKLAQEGANEAYQGWKAHFSQYETSWAGYWDPLHKAQSAEETGANVSEEEPVSLETSSKTDVTAETKVEQAVENSEKSANQAEKENMPVAELNQEIKVETTQLNNQGLSADDQVLFVGDSLMQGVAPFIQKWLSTEFNIKSIDLSKQSTGLSYPSFFDWPATVEQQLKANHKIKLVIVFLGPNDPWDFPNPKGGKYLKFQSEEWEAVYGERINRILNAAERANAKVIWLGVPYMKKAKLNDQMLYLNQVLEKNLAHRVTFLPTQLLLSGNQHTYLDTIMIDGKSTRVRSKDGIHFSPAGQKYIAQYVEKHIAISAKPVEKAVKNIEQNKGKK